MYWILHVKEMGNLLLQHVICYIWIMWELGKVDRDYKQACFWHISWTDSKVEKHWNKQYGDVDLNAPYSSLCITIFILHELGKKDPIGIQLISTKWIPCRCVLRLWNSYMKHQLSWIFKQQLGIICMSRRWACCMFSTTISTKLFTEHYWRALKGLLPKHPSKAGAAPAWNKQFQG